MTVADALISSVKPSLTKVTVHPATVSVALQRVCILPQ